MERSKRHMMAHGERLLCGPARLTLKDTHTIPGRTHETVCPLLCPRLWSGPEGVRGTRSLEASLLYRIHRAPLDLRNRAHFLDPHDINSRLDPLLFGFLNDPFPGTRGIGAHCKSEHALPLPMLLTGIGS